MDECFVVVLEDIAAAHFALHCISGSTWIEDVSKECCERRMIDLKIMHVNRLEDCP